MNDWMFYLIAGLCGGLLRALVGVTKSKEFEEKKFVFRPFYFAVTVLTAALVGVAAGLLAGESWKLAFLAGYAGSDFLESMYKLSFLRSARCVR